MTDAQKEMLEFWIIGKVDGCEVWREEMQFATPKEAAQYAKRRKKQDEKKGWKGTEISAVPR